MGEGDNFSSKYIPLDPGLKQQTDRRTPGSSFKPSQSSVSRNMEVEILINLNTNSSLALEGGP